MNIYKNIIAGRADCYTFCIFSSLLMHLFEYSWIGWRDSIWNVHYKHYALPTAGSLCTLVTPQCNPIPQCITVRPVPKFRS